MIQFQGTVNRLLSIELLTFNLKEYIPERYIYKLALNASLPTVFIPDIDV